MFAAVILAFVAAVVPAAIFVLIAWTIDRYEKEPWWLLTGTFFWGAVPSVIAAAILELVFQGGAQVFLDAESTGLAVVAIAAPLVEESLKGIAVLAIYWIFRRQFDGLMDGLLYGAIVGFGFAMTENFMYFLGAYQQAGWQGMEITIVLRVFFGLMHALWTSMFGLGLGIARYSRNLGIKLLAPALGLACGMMLHCIHNYCMSIGSMFWLVSLIVYLGGVVGWCALVWTAGLREARWIREELAEEVAAGTLSAHSALAAGRYRERAKARWRALWEHGFGRAHQLGRLYDRAASLAFRKRQARLLWKESALQEEPHLLPEITTLRDEIRMIETQLLTVG